MSIYKGTQFIAGSGGVEDVKVNGSSVVTDGIAEVSVGNGTITFTQGGTNKGSFTTNQSGNSTIALDSGGEAPTGSIVSFGGSTAPSGWLICDGSAISRTNYSALFAVIGTTYGAGDGSTTFQLPNLTSRVPFMYSGKNNGAIGDGELPDITGEFYRQYADGVTSVSGAFYKINGGTHRDRTNTANTDNGVGFAASLSKSAYSRTDNNVIPRYLVIKYIIKY